MKLTERQQNELEYHRQHARDNAELLSKPFSYEVLEKPSRRWWNAYWHMFRQLIQISIAGKRILVVGCGFGADALRLAKLGGDVYAFDLSPESLSIAKALAEREQLNISFEQMTAENLSYEDDFFDLVVARDILHHVDIPLTMKELRRVSKPGAQFVVNEIYSHSLTDKIRHSTLVEKFLYPRMQRMIYQGKPYITEDERKLTETDIEAITGLMDSVDFKTYFNFLVTRIIPDRFELASRLDRILLIVLRPIAGLIAGRVILHGRF